MQKLRYVQFSYLKHVFVTRNHYFTYVDSHFLSPSLSLVLLLFLLSVFVGCLFLSVSIPFPPKTHWLHFRSLSNWPCKNFMLTWTEYRSFELIHCIYARNLFSIRFITIYIYVCKCVCVCARETERKSVCFLVFYFVCHFSWFFILLCFVLFWFFFSFVWAMFMLVLRWRSLYSFIHWSFEKILCFMNRAPKIYSPTKIVKTNDLVLPSK